MKGDVVHIFTTSLSEAADRFLHAGYVSATPSGIVADYPTLQDTENLGYAATLPEAFATSTAQVPVETAMTAAPGLLEVLAGAGPAAWCSAALAMIALAAAVVTVRRIKPRPILPARVTAALAALMLAVAVGACLDDPDGDPTGTQEILLLDDPEQATLAMMHVALREALITHHRLDATATELGDVEPYLALPTLETSEGLQMMLDDHTRDAWGQPYLFESHTVDHPQYQVTSIGEDGLAGTGDDLELVVEPEELLDPNNLANQHKVYYLQRKDGELWVYARIYKHSAEDPTIEWGDGDIGEVQFDHFRAVPLDADFQAYWWDLAYNTEPEPDWEANVAFVENLYQSFVTEEAHEPLVMQIFEPALLAD